MEQKEIHKLSFGNKMAELWDKQRNPRESSKIKNELSFSDEDRDETQVIERTIIEERQITSLGVVMAELWANNIATGEQRGIVRLFSNRERYDIQSRNTGEIKNDDASRKHIESLLRRQGITHKATFDNLVFDYLNTPIGIRDEIMAENIPHVHEQLTVRQEQMKAQQQAGYVVPSFEVVQPMDNGMY